MNHYFNEKISLIMSLLIINNYLLLSLNLPQIITKINFLVFLLFVLIFYSKNFSENIFLKISFLFIIFISLGVVTDGWDARSIWLFHAKRIFYENTIFSIADNYASFSHNAYPTLAPAFAASLGKLVGHWNEIFPKIAFSFIFLPVLIFSTSLFKNSHYLIFLSIIFFTIGNYLFNGWADGLLAAYFCLSVLMMYLIIISDDSHYKNNIYNFIGFCFFITLTLIKNEGLALLSIIFLVTFLMLIYKSQLSKKIYSLIILSLSFLPIFLWKYYCFLNGIGNEFINQDIFTNLFPRIFSLSNYADITYFLYINEKFLIPLIFFLISFKIKWNRELFIFVSSIFLLYSIILYFIFLSTPHDFAWQLNTSAARIIKSFNFLLAFFGLYNLFGLKLKN